MTNDIPSCAETVSAKRGLFLVFMPSFITDKLVENIVNFTNKYADIIIHDPVIQARITEKHQPRPQGKKVGKTS